MAELKRVMIVAGESSGELYGSLLAKELKVQNPELKIIGVGGEKMESSGVDLIARISSAFGIIEAVKTYREIKNTFQKVIASLKSFSPQVVVLIDYPDFNIRVAKEAKKLGIKVLYYVSPQVWAWRRKRINVIGSLIDRMAVILPFEEELYKQHNIPCEFVGHPVMDEIREVMSDLGFQISDFNNQQSAISNLKSKIREELRLSSDKPVLTLMPGSREHEIKKLLPEMSAVMKAMKDKKPDCQFVIPVAPNLSKNSMSLINALKQSYNNELHFTNNSIKALLTADAAVITSGTSALQAAFLNIPMVVVYRLSSLTYFLGRLLVKVKYISLPNILLDKSAEDDSGLRIKELLQDSVSSQNIMKELGEIMDDAKYRNGMIAQLRKVRNLFVSKNASVRTAEIVKELIY